jgi:CTP:molybdopterin cytidylyltransferase MocA
MAGPRVLIFHRPARADDAPLARLLAEARLRLAEQQAGLFGRLGAKVVFVHGAAGSFGERLADAAPRGGGIVVLGSGAVPRLSVADARRLIDVAAGGGRHGLTNNRYSSDVCAISDAAVLTGVPPLPSDNALPRWLEERAAFSVGELSGRDRLALDIDTPQDIALWALAPGAPSWTRTIVAEHGLAIPRLAELRALAGDAYAELMLFGRAGSTTLRWLERNVRCRVRLLAEERGLRAASPLAIGEPAGRRPPRPPRATLGLLLDARGPSSLGEVVGELADGAILDSRVLLAHRLGPDESGWPAAADRYASDLLQPELVADPWLRALTISAAESDRPIVLGAHTLVGPGVRLLLRGARDGADGPGRAAPERG